MEMDYDDIMSVELDEDVDISLKILSPKSNILSSISSPSKQNSFNEDDSNGSSNISINKKLSIHTHNHIQNSHNNFFITVSPIKE